MYIYIVIISNRYSKKKKVTAAKYLIFSNLITYGSI